MAKIAPYIFFQEFDDNGNPLALGKLYTYEAGTTTPKATFTDSTEATQNTNPIILDASGRAEVWLGSGAYKFVLDDASDVLVKEVDSVSGDSINAFGGQVFDVSTNTNVTTAYQNAVIIATGTITLSLLDATTAGEGFVASIRNSGSGTVTIDPDGSETINGASTLPLTQDEWAIVICDGTNWRALDKQDPALGTMASQDADSVSITGGSITGITDIAIADGGTGAGTAAAAFTNLKQDATTSATGVVELATAAEVESETSGKVPTADVLFNHPGIAKAACKADGTGTPSFDWNHNFSTITRSSTGVYDFTMSVTFASATSYSVAALSDVLNYARVENKTTTGFRLTFQATGISSVDIDDINVVVFGDLA